jgi:hypothetical protein
MMRLGLPTVLYAGLCSCHRHVRRAMTRHLLGISSFTVGLGKLSRCCLIQNSVTASGESVSHLLKTEFFQN